MAENVETILKVLRFLESRGGQVHVRDLAQHLWPKSKYWKTPAKRRNASGFREKGVRLHTAAGALCGRLASRGLVCKVATGIYEITQSGRQYLASPPAPAVPVATPASPAPQPSPWRWGWVFWPDGRWYQALVGQVQGTWCPVAFSDGRQFSVDARCVAYA